MQAPGVARVGFTPCAHAIFHSHLVYVDRLVMFSSRVCQCYAATTTVHQD